MNRRAPPARSGWIVREGPTGRFEWAHESGRVLVRETTLKPHPMRFAVLVLMGSAWRESGSYSTAAKALEIGERDALHLARTELGL